MRGVIDQWQSSRWLLPELERVLGRDHPKTFIIRSNIAYWTGQRGDLAGALHLCKKLLRDEKRVLGRDDPKTQETLKIIRFLEWEIWFGNR